MAVEIEWLRIAGRERLFEEDDVADAAYFVVRGRFRDSDVVRVDRATFDRLLRDNPRNDGASGRHRGEGTRDALRGRTLDAGRLSTLAVLVEDGVEDAPWAVETLVAELARHGPVQHLIVGDGTDGLSGARLIAAIDEQQARGGLTVLDIDLRSSGGAQRGLRQADAVVVVAGAAPHWLGGSVPKALGDLHASGGTPTMTLVLGGGGHARWPMSARRHAARFRGVSSVAQRTR